MQNINNGKCLYCNKLPGRAHEQSCRTRLEKAPFELPDRIEYWSVAWTDWKRPEIIVESYWKTKKLADDRRDYLQKVKPGFDWFVQTKVICFGMERSVASQDSAL